MTRGRCGSLRLHRKALSSSPPRRFIPAFSFVAQGYEWVDPRCAARGYPTSKKSNSRKQTKDDRKGKRVGRPNADDKATDHACPGKRQGQPHHETHPDYSESLVQNHLEDVVRRGAHGHANSDFLRTLRGSVGNHAVDSNDSQHQAEQPHRRSQLRAKTEQKESIRTLQCFVHRFDLSNGKLFTYTTHFRPGRHPP